MPVPRRRRKAKDAAEPSEAELTGEEGAEGAESDPKAADADDETGGERDETAVAGEGATGTEEDEAGPAAADEAEATDEAEPDPSADGEADAEEERKAAPRGRRGAAETTTRKEPARSAPRREGDGAVQVRAQAKYVRRAPRKARLVMDHIRGRDVKDARAILRHTQRAAAGDIAKLLDSAVANAENNFELDADDLKVDRAFVDEGPTIKRYRPRALGRATRIDKRTSHMTITLTMRSGAGGGRR